MVEETTRLVMVVSVEIGGAIPSVEVSVKPGTLVKVVVIVSVPLVKVEVNVWVRVDVWVTNSVVDDSVAGGGGGISVVLLSGMGTGTV